MMDNPAITQLVEMRRSGDLAGVWQMPDARVDARVMAVMIHARSGR